ncbi:MAG TPA: exodeoxyribonuclease VII small subunit [Gammaproteobacteria bacterium]|nr:exodeoxyribonuclease VII small subunit [Gammaproteobacteria bacterium]
MAARKTPRKSAEEPDFETALAELEQLVERMEKGELSLEDSLRDFERGVELTRLCQQALKAAEQKIQILSKDGGEGELTPFEDED